MGSLVRRFDESPIIHNNKNLDVLDILIEQVE